MLEHFETPPPIAEVQRQLERLERQAARSDPLHFAGREGIIEAVLGYAEDLPPKGSTGNTVAILGAPGAGKTSLISEIVRRLEAAGIAAINHAEVPESPEEVEGAYWDIANTLYGISPEISRTTTTEGARGSLGVAGVLSVGGGVESAVSPPRIASIPAITKLPEACGKAFKKSAVVLVDEIQNIEPKGAARMLARDIHTQGVAPVLLVCAGLSDSLDRMGDAGLSRVDNIVRLGPLSMDEASEAARETMLRVRSALHIPGAPEPVVRAADVIARESSGWPMHIHNYLRGVWRALRLQNIPSFDALDMREAIRFGSGLRSDYYERRLSSANVPVEVVQALYSKIERARREGAVGVFRHGAEIELARAVANIKDDQTRDHAMRVAETGEICFDRLLRTGVVSLETSDSGTPGAARYEICSVPIPSLAAHVREKASLSGPVLTASKIPPPFQSQRR